MPFPQSQLPGTLIVTAVEDAEHNKAPTMGPEIKNVVQVPADVDTSDLPENIRAGDVFYVGALPYICEETDRPGLLVADHGEDGFTTVPEDVERFFVIRQVFHEP